MEENKYTNTTADEDKMIDDAFQELLNDYLASQHRKKVEIITKAFNFAKQAHKGVRRLSGEPYIMHPIAVAKIVCNEIGLGSTSICSALLHDVVEDTDYTVEDIENIFGPKIAEIVDGLTKIAGGIFGDHASAQAENFKKLLLTMNDDIRVILIKIADRLHNMRTLGSQKPEKQYKIAGETMYIYAPLANRLGLNAIKTELEDLSFRFEYPEEYKRIEDKLALTQAKRDEVFDEFTAPIRAELDKWGMKYTIKARVKSPYSIWNKMQNKHVSFEEIYDILAVRIIFEPLKDDQELNECFDIYIAVTKIYKPHPDRLRDWISRPKANGYQALHVTLMSNQGAWIECQIRSKRMDDIAEQGFAAHWKYKEGTTSEGELEKWLHTIKEILDNPQPDAIDFLDTIKLNLYASEIFVFTPKGEIKTMPADCTALDFAFSIHTFLGSHCIGAKVNHKLVPISHKLQSGDQVEILTSKSQHIQPSWITFVSTAKAKAKIEAILRKEKRENQKQGEDDFRAFAEQNGIDLATVNLGTLLDLHNLETVDELYQKIGSKSIVLSTEDANALLGKDDTQKKTWRRFIPFFGNKTGKPKKKKEKTIKNKTVDRDGNETFIKIDTSKPIILTEESLAQTYTIADCCNPIPGDDVLGYINDRDKVFIHKRQCNVAYKLKSSYGNRILAAMWQMNNTTLFTATIQIQGIDVFGLLNSVTSVLTIMQININKLNIETRDGIFYCKIEVNVHNTSEVDAIMDRLKQIDSIKEIARV